MDDLASELREARHMAGVSQSHVAQAAGLNQSRVSRTERGRRLPPRIDELARHCAVLGLRLYVRVYPEGPPVRDAGQLRLLLRFRAQLGDHWGWRTEVLIGGYGDLRAWDVVLAGTGKIGIDAETRLHDMQALQRRCETKWRDSRLDRLVLLVSATPHNRSVLRAHRAALASTFPLDTADVMRALRRGDLPDGNGIAVL